MVPGTVLKILPFSVVVELAPGVTGQVNLADISKDYLMQNQMRRYLPIGEKIKARTVFYKGVVYPVYVHFIKVCVSPKFFSFEWCVHCCSQVFPLPEQSFNLSRQSGPFDVSGVVQPADLTAPCA